MAKKQPQDPGAAYPGGGEMGALIRAMDWSATPIGPMESWSPSLRMMVRFLLANRFPLLLWWGPDYISIYNDPYRPILGAKHPWALGKPVRECWHEIWHVLQPLIDTPFKGGPSTWNDDIQLEINRHGFLEETHFTIAYSPVPDDTVAGGVGGVLATVHEITEKVVAERRVVALRDLGAGVGEASTAEQACSLAAAALARHAKDVPFALLYLLDDGGRQARLAGAAGFTSDAPGPQIVDLGDAAADPWRLAEALRTQAAVVTPLGEHAAAPPPGPWSDPPSKALVLKVPSNKPHEPAGVLVAGVSARLKLDDYYRDFLGLVAAQVASAVARARAYEEERQRAEALAAIDRAKTAFFSNVSHEFRTPLTLMLGPLEDALAKPVGAPSRDDLSVMYRNTLRLLKLVNSLLDFARSEAGRVQASYEPVDLAALTRDLASAFRSAVEKGGVRFEVDCPPLPQPVYVDRSMWEKVVLNLLSNAFKYTLEGEITVSLTRIDDRVELRVRDTGTGIPATELPHIFERFHRIEGSRPHPRRHGNRPGPGTGPGIDARGRGLCDEPARRRVDLQGDAAARQGTPARRADQHPRFAGEHRHRRAAVRRGGVALAARRSPAGSVDRRGPRAECGTGDARPGANPDRGRQRGHARLPVAIAAAAVRRLDGAGWCFGAPRSTRIAARPGADRRDDARARRLRPAARPARRSAHRGDPGDRALRAGGR